MPVGTHLGPWLLGTTKSSTGNTAALTRDTGATIVAQTSVVNTSSDTATIVATGIWIPAGARLVFITLDTPSPIERTACPGDQLLSLWFRGRAIDSGAKNSTASATGTDYQLGSFSPPANPVPAYTRIYGTFDFNGTNYLYPNPNNVSESVNTDRQLWSLIYSDAQNPATVQITVGYMVRNTNTTYQPSSTTGP
jgi:hypothetical protein